MRRVFIPKTGEVKYVKNSVEAHDILNKAYGFQTGICMTEDGWKPLYTEPGQNPCGDSYKEKSQA